MTRAPISANADVVVLVPTYNEAGVITEVIAGLRTHFARVVVIDDGSSDGSAALAQSAGAVVVQHSSNLGQGAALATGFEYALRCTKAPLIVTFDADGQHRVEDAIALAARLREGDVDVVLGSRFLGSTSEIPRSRRRLLRAATAWIRRTTGLEVTDAHNGLRALTRRAASLIALRQRGMAHGSEILHLIAKAHLSYTEVPVLVRYTDYSRAKGQRGINAFNVLYDLAVAKVRLAR